MNQSRSHNQEKIRGGFREKRKPQSEFRFVASVYLMLAVVAASFSPFGFARL